MATVAEKSSVNRIAALNGGNGKKQQDSIREQFFIPEIDKRVLELTVIGETPFITHNWSEKAKKMMLDKQMGVAAQKREKRDPWREYVDSFYWISKKPESPTESDVKKATFGIPSRSFKASVVAACRQIEGIKMTELKGAIFILGELNQIYGQPRMVEDMVRLDSGTADLRFRPYFDNWYCKIKVQYKARQFNPSQIINLFEHAGFSCGVGDWRPNSPHCMSGENGRFHTLKDGEKLPSI